MKKDLLTISFFFSLFFFLSLFLSPIFCNNWAQKMSVIEGKKEYCWVIGNKDFKANYVIATNQKDEERLAEWIGHHLLMGFDGVLIYDDYSSDPVSFLNYLPLDAREKVVIFLRCPSGTFLPKTKIQERVANTAGLVGAKWALSLDADEFLTINPNQFRDLPSWLKSFPDNVSQIVCNWLMYGTSFRNSSPKGLLFDSYTYRQKKPDNRIKCLQKIFSPNVLWEVRFPHYMTNRERGKEEEEGGERVLEPKPRGIEEKKKLGEFVLGNGKEWTIPYPVVVNENVNSTCLIAHYYLQSMEDCYKRKLLRPRDDVHKFRGHSFCNHDEFNDVNDPDRMKKYAQALEIFLIRPKDSKLLTLHDFIPGFSFGDYKRSDTKIRPNLDKLMQRKENNLKTFAKDPHFRE